MKKNVQDSDQSPIIWGRIGKTIGRIKIAVESQAPAKTYSTIVNYKHKNHPIIVDVRVTFMRRLFQEQLVQIQDIRVILYIDFCRLEIEAWRRNRQF